jgi:hypothetical protein
MRRIFLLAAAVLAACSTAPAAPIVHGNVPGHICNAAGTERFIGQPGNSETGAAILKASNSAILRWAPPDSMLTMDYSASRVTVHLDHSNKVTEIKCG